MVIEIELCFHSSEYGVQAIQYIEQNKNMNAETNAHFQFVKFGNEAEVMVVFSKNVISS